MNKTIFDVVLYKRVRPTTCTDSLQCWLMYAGPAPVDIIRQRSYVNTVYGSSECLAPLSILVITSLLINVKPLLLNVQISCVFFPIKPLFFCNPLLDITIDPYFSTFLFPGRSPLHGYFILLNSISCQISLAWILPFYYTTTWKVTGLLYIEAPLTIEP